MSIRAFDGQLRLGVASRSGLRPVSTVTWAALVLLCALAHAQAPTNDACTNATILTQPNFPYHITQDGFMATGDTVNADLTALGGGTSDPVQFGHGVWFSFTPTNSGYISFSDAALDVLNGDNRFFTLTTACGAAAISGHAYDPFAANVNGAGGVECHVTAGQTLKILVSNGADIFGPDAPTANYDLTFNFFPSYVPTNGTCATAIDLSSSLPFSDIVDNTMANDFPVSAGDCAGSTIYHGVWYKYTTSVRGYLTCTTGSTGAIPALFGDTDFSFLQPTIWATADNCGDNAACIGDATSPRYVILNAGQTVYILVGSSASNIDGLARLRPSITFTAAPSNDTCITALNLNASGLPFTGSFDFFSAKSDISQTDCFQAFRGVWFTYTPSWTGYLGFNSTASFATWAHTSDCAAQATCDGSGGGDGNTIGRIPITAGQPIKILFASTTPDLAQPNPRALSFDLAPDDCETALPIAIPSTTSGDLTYATATSPQIPGICGNPADRDYWYRVTIATAGQYTFTLTSPDNVGADSRLALALFSGCPSASGTLLACTAAPVAAATPQTIQMNLLPGTYRVRVAYGGGAFTLSVSGPPACLADFDHNSTVNVNDIFAFLRAWFAHSPSADIDGNSAVNVNDIFAFLRHWFAHC